ncbi:MAG: cation:proton antiporter [Candidatus Delongbacteria bacterium]
MIKRLYIVLFFVNISALSASTGGSEVNITHQMTVFVFQLGIIIFAAKFCGMLFEKFKMSGTLGEIVAGIIIGPYMLGSFSLPLLGFPEGLFPAGSGVIPISSELYGISIIASIILLFTSGLETDIKLLLKYIFSGGIVGIGGVIFTFIPGAMVGMFFLDKPFLSPECLFLGIMSTATSVGVTAMILSKNKFMESPEGVTIMSAAVIDDVFGIVFLSIVVAVSAALTMGGPVDWSHIGVVSFKAIGVWLGLTAAGLVLSKKLSSFLKKFRSKYAFAVMSLGMALFLAGLFEKAGLAMIIGAYVMGLSLSNTDISFEIQEAVHPTKEFFVPIFFAVMGMMVDLSTITAGTLLFGFIYALVSLSGKVAGCGIHALFTGFNKKGALRIGLGMMPRGEVVLIIAGIGLSNGFMDQNIYGSAVMMVLLSIILTPALLSYSLKIPGRGTKKPLTKEEQDSYLIDMQNAEQADILLQTIIQYFDKEGYFITKLVLDYDVYQIRKGGTFLKLLKGSKEENANRLNFIARKEDIEFVKELVYEAMVKLEYNSSQILKKVDLKEMKKSSHKLNRAKIKINYDISKILDPSCVIMDMKADNKSDAIGELVDLLAINDKICDRDAIYKEVMTRESVISTGMQNGLAIPHARSEGLESTQIAIGIKRSGIEFESLDGKPSKVIILLVSSTKKDDPHIFVLSAISAYFHDIQSIEEFLSLENEKEIVDFFRLEGNKRSLIKKVVRRFGI